MRQLTKSCTPTAHSWFGGQVDGMVLSGQVRLFRQVSAVVCDPMCFVEVPYVPQIALMQVSDNNRGRKVICNEGTTHLAGWWVRQRPFQYCWVKGTIRGHSSMPECNHMGRQSFAWTMKSEKSSRSYAWCIV